MKTPGNMRTLTLALLVVGISTWIFTVCMVWMFIKYQMVPDVLVERFYTCVVGELGMMGMIQVVKTIRAGKDRQAEEKAPENG